MKLKLLNDLKKKNARIGIFGLGYVGLPLAILYAKQGFKVTGFDIDSSKIKTLNSKQSYISYIKPSVISNFINKNLTVTTDFSLSKDMDAMIICVPTPLKKKKPDLSFVINTIKNLQPYIRKGQVLSLESTTYPGTTEEEIMPRIERKGFKIGKDFFLVYSPEREDPGNIKFKNKAIPKVVSGVTNECLTIGKELYNSIVNTVVAVSSPRIAEMTKLLENIYRAVNIGLVNEMKIVADGMKINIFEVINAAATKPFGFAPFYPGPGLGGHCIPIDPFYLSWKAKKIGIETNFIKLAGIINTNMPRWVVNKSIKILRSKGKRLDGAKVLILGIAYKKNIEDTRESPGVELIRIFKTRGAKVSYSDPYLPKFPKMRNYKFKMKSVVLKPNIIKKFDIVLLITDHDKFNYKMIEKNSKIIIDTRGVFLNEYSNVFRA